MKGLVLALALGAAGAAVPFVTIGKDVNGKDVNLPLVVSIFCPATAANKNLFGT